MLATLNASWSGARQLVTLAVASRLRVGTALICLGVAFAEGRALVALPWVLAVTALEVTADLWRPRRTALLAVQTLVVVAALAATVPTTLALLPLLLVPAFRAGDVHGRVTAASVCLVLLSGPVAVAAVLVAAGQPSARGVTATVQWWLLACGLGFLAAWNRRVEDDRTQPERALAREAGQLLGRLRDVALALPAGLDAPAVAHIILEQVVAQVPAERSAVLAQVGVDQVSPLAVRGIERVPWRDPIRSSGTAHRAWATRSVTVDYRPPDEHGRRHGSALLCLPLADREDELLGLVVLERLDGHAFADEEVDAATHVVDRMVLHLHAALAFTELRHLTEVSERERLAREMHNGVAQDLSALGFSIDLLTRSARSVDPALADRTRQLRGDLNRTIRDIRLSIADLRSSAQPDRGLGAAVSSHVESLAAATGAEVTLSLRESTFRLPSHVESALLRLVQDFLTDVRTQPGVRQVGVTLNIDAPEARIALSRSGGTDWTPDQKLVGELESRGGYVRHLASSDGVSSVLGVQAPSATGASRSDFAGLEVRA